jgi:hypothetical protein
LQKPQRLKSLSERISWEKGNRQDGGYPLSFCYVAQKYYIILRHLFSAFPIAM